MNTSVNVIRGALLLACLTVLYGAPVGAQTATVPNPLQKGRVGDWIEYDYQLRSPARSIVGTLRLELKKKDDEKKEIKVVETLSQGNRGSSKETATYPYLKRDMVAQIEAIYQKQFKNWKRLSVKVESAKLEVAGHGALDCQRLVLAFEATQQSFRCRGDLVYYLKAGVGPMGVVKFQSNVSYETGEGRGFMLTQETEMIARKWNLRR